MRTFITLILALVLTAAAGPPTLAELTRRYARDDLRLAGALRYERADGGVREQAWVLETGEVVKASRETRGEKADVLEEFSVSGDGDVYFVFRKVTERMDGGGTRVTEERAYIAESQTLQKTHRTADFPAGAAAEIPAKVPSEKVDVAKLADDVRSGTRYFQEAEKITDAVRVPALLVHDPAKDAPADWQRVKLVRGTLSPDGRYALAWAPEKKDFKWADYRFDGSDDEYWAEPGGEDVVNFITDLKTHRIAGKTSGVHFGTRQRYNHRECVMTWSPDSRTFIELNTEKWSYAACCIGHLTDGKLDTVQDLAAAVDARAKEFLKADKHRGYRRHAKDMLTALHKPELKNDGTGSIDVTLQVPKSVEDDAYVRVRVRFRLATEKNRIEMLGAALVPE